MKGKGTSENPYIIMTADDLFSMSETGGNDTYFSLGTDIDFNNTPYAENFMPIPLNCKKLSGNSHVIRNVNYVTPDGNASMFVLTGETQNITIENLYIENIRLSGKNVFLFGNSGKNNSISLKHCTVVMNDMIILDATSADENYRHCIVHDDGIAVSADYCTFVIKAQSYRIYPFFSGDRISHTQLNLEIYANAFAGTTGGYNSMITDSVVSDSYFFVNIASNKTSGLVAVDFSSHTCKFSGCYLVCDVCSVVLNVYWYGEIQSTCFYDIDVLRKNNQIALVDGDNLKNIRRLTTQQCKDAEYLRSIGFSCMGA
ncbi:MAG: hypothetical protein K2J36_06840 [Ruminococcus sp.]|nr:hypothetical protein [Ruminococcus sp.]MDE6797708.1 hypothetical protein [Ruminococcus sp.]